MEKTRLFQEGSARFYATPPEKAANNSTVLTKDASIFYNPVMRMNRDICLCAITAFAESAHGLRIADILAGSGIRAIRILNEIADSDGSVAIHSAIVPLVKSVLVNDAAEGFRDTIERNFRESGIDPNDARVEVHNTDANILLKELSSKGRLFDFIDIDPFGSPNHFLKAAIGALSEKGMLAVTATDTAALCGSAVRACRRKYGAEPLHNSLMYEAGLRILIRHVQKVALSQKMILVPVLSYMSRHYARAYFTSLSYSEKTAGEILLQHNFIAFSKVDFSISTGETELILKEKHPDATIAGPMWTGNLNGMKFLKRCAACSAPFTDKESSDFLLTLLEESKVEALGYYDVHSIAKALKLKAIPKFESILSALKEKGISCSRTTFLKTAIKADCSGKEFIAVIDTI